VANYLRYRTNNAELEQVQDSVEMAFDEVNQVDILNGRLLEDLDVLTSPQLFPHRLGRRFKGFIVVDSTADVRVFRDAASDSDPTIHLPLQATTTATVKVWVF
tara:strand:+ start:438 stop:746 length:309 start_codon:yes stop_codon:yes gene_type:complete